jgi:hypothetical protein
MFVNSEPLAHLANVADGLPAGPDPPGHTRAKCPSEMDPR